MQVTKQPLVILAGPTAVGKTKLSIRLAKAIDGEIISADSMQVYKHMDIGSAKIQPKEMEGVPHYLVDELEPWEEFHVVRFQEMAKSAVEKICAKGKVPILTGGTGFYIQALLYDIDFTKNRENTALRRELERQVKDKGAEELHNRLREVDPVSARLIHANNVKRVIRALEFYELTGQPISGHNEEQRRKESPYLSAYFALMDDRESLYRRIDRRVDEMLEQGLVEEVRDLKKMGCTRDMVAMQGLGYKEILDYLDGKCTLDEAVYTLKRDTRHFAKRQITWLKRERDVIWLDRREYAGREEDILKAVLDILRGKGILAAEKGRDTVKDREWKG